MAPEIITNKGYGKPADFYALGIMLYEMTVGRCPFMNNNPYKIF
jgi:serine/threonine protein kinase